MITACIHFSKAVTNDWEILREWSLRCKRNSKVYHSPLLVDDSACPGMFYRLQVMLESKKNHLVERVLAR